jgi:hypothetical protein
LYRPIPHTGGPCNFRPREESEEKKYYCNLTKLVVLFVCATSNLAPLRACVANSFVDSVDDTVSFFFVLVITASSYMCYCTQFAMHLYPDIYTWLPILLDLNK